MLPCRTQSWRRWAADVNQVEVTDWRRRWLFPRELPKVCQTTAPYASRTFVSIPRHSSVTLPAHGGSLLWFLTLPTETIYFDQSTSHETRRRVIEIVAKRLGRKPAEMVRDASFIHGLDVGADSLAMVELVIELEEELGHR